PVFELTPETVERVFQAACDQLDEVVLVHMLKKADRVELRPPATLLVHFPGHLANAKTYCEESSRIGKVEAMFRELVGRPVNLRLELGAESDKSAAPIKRESYGKL